MTDLWPWSPDELDDAAEESGAVLADDDDDGLLAAGAAEVLLTDESVSEDEAVGAAEVVLAGSTDELVAVGLLELAEVLELAVEKQAVDPSSMPKGSETTASPDDTMVRSSRYEPGETLTGFQV